VNAHLDGVCSQLGSRIARCKGCVDRRVACRCPRDPASDTIGAMTLDDVLSDLDSFPADGVIVAVKHGETFRADSEARVLSLDEEEQTLPVHRLAKLRAPGMSYVLEVDLAREVIDDQRTKRGRTPTTDEAIEAIVFFVEEDELLPLDE
jgi:hypothetical protein